MTVQIALLGAGRIGRVHGTAVKYTAGANLAAVFDPFEEAAAALSAEHGCPIRTLDEIEADGTVDAVIVATPTDTHADLIERFAAAGKAIFCEKPIDLDISRARECVAFAQKKNVALMLGFNRRFDPHFTALKAGLDAGQAGDIETVQITSRDPGAPPPAYIKVSGGIFRDMTIHDFDMARFLLTDEPVSVFAEGSVLVDPEIDALGDYDTASVILKTATGKQCIISNSRRATYGYDQRIEVHGSRGMIAAENMRPAHIEVATAEGFTRPPLHDFFMTRYTDAYRIEITAFIEALKTGTRPAPSGEDGVRALELANAATESARTGTLISL